MKNKLILYILMLSICNYGIASQVPQKQHDNCLLKTVTAAPYLFAATIYATSGNDKASIYCAVIAAQSKLNLEKKKIV